MTVLVGAGLLGGHALAVTVPVPTVPTVTVPTLPVTVTTPTATVSTPTATVSAPTTSASLPTVAPPALPAGAVVQRVTIVVVKAGAPTREQIIAARAANVCVLSAASGSTGASNTSSPQGALTPGQPSASGPVGAGNTHPGGVLGSTVATAARAVQPFLVALLALAIVLLTVASLPRPALSDSRANQILARHRMEIAGLGAAVWGVIALLLS